MDALAQILQRASEDADFKALLIAAPEAAIKGYEIPAEEREAVLEKLRNLDAEEITSHGQALEQRIAKAPVKVGG